MTSKAMLLMRESPCQIFCANTLFRSGAIDSVYIEDGSIGEPDGAVLARRLWRYGPDGIWQRVQRDLRHFDGSARTLLDYYVTRLRTAGLMNRQAWQEARILGAAGRRLDHGVRLIRASSVNDPQCRRLIQEGGYRLVFVFGTSLLKQELLAMEGVTFVNLHHGWLPRFRGEGILTALAEEGADSLGVSVHRIDQGVDTGSILYRERLAIEAGDNAHAIALKATVRGTALFQQVYDDVTHGILRQGIPQAPEEGRSYSSRVLKTRYRMRVAALRALRAASAPSQTPPLWLKRAVARSCAAGGLTVLSRKRHGRRLRMLMYHGVMPQIAGPAAFGNLFLDLEMLARHLRYLARHFSVISLDEVLDCFHAGRAFPERALAITFDDGYRALLTRVLPLARRHRLPITVFVPAGDITKGAALWFDVLRVLVSDAERERRTVRVDEELVIDGALMRNAETTFLALSRRILSLPSERAERVIGVLLAAGQAARVLERHPEFCLAGWEEWRTALAGGGLIVGSHGWTHRNLTDLPPAAREQELHLAKHQIERAVGRPCRIVAYPYGAWNHAVAEAARRVGYESGVTTDPGLSPLTHDPWQLHRDTVGNKGSWPLFCARASGLLDPRA